MVDVSVVNSLIIYQEFVEKFGEKMTNICTGQLEYTKSLAFQLMSVGYAEINDVPNSSSNCSPDFMSRDMNVFFVKKRSAMVTPSRATRQVFVAATVNCPCA